MSQSGRFSLSVSPGTYVQQIDGDVGSATGAIITFQANPYSGSTLEFFASSDVVIFLVTDINGNTIVGNTSGNTSGTGTNNTFLGAASFQDYTSGSHNVGLGYGTLPTVTSGSYNIALGGASGSNYTSSESSNILLNNSGTASESHVLRIGAGTGTGN